MEGFENHEPPRFCIEVIVPRGGWKLAVLRLHGATLQSAVEATVDIHCKTAVLVKINTGCAYTAEYPSLEEHTQG